MPTKAVAQKTDVKPVVAFRLTASEAKVVGDAFDKTPVVGIRSPGLLARKLLLDLAYGHIKYRTEKYRTMAPEMYIPELMPAKSRQT